jgi:hypothetical protein
MTSSSPLSRPSPPGGLRPALTAGCGRRLNAASGSRPQTKIHQFQVFTVSGDCLTLRASTDRGGTAVAQMSERGVVCSELHAERWGLITRLTLPGAENRRLSANASRAAAGGLALLVSHQTRAGPGALAIRSTSAHRARSGALHAADIPCSEKSSGGVRVVAPGGVFVVGVAGLQTAVQDADEAVCELPQGGLVADVAAAQCLVVRGGAG